MSAGFWCSWRIDLPVGDKIFQGESGIMGHSCRESAAGRCSALVADILRRYSSSGYQIVCMLEESPQADYFWYLRSGMKIHCHTAINVSGGVVDKVMDKIKNRVLELFPNVQLTDVSGKYIDGWGHSVNGLGFDINGDITVYSAFFWTQLLLRAARLSDNIKSFDNDLWLKSGYYHSYNRLLSFLQDYKDRTPECAAYQMVIVDGPGEMATMLREGRLRKFFGKDKPDKSGQARLDEIVALLQ